MTAQKVMTQAANLFGSATGNVSTKGKQAANGFDLVIGRTMKTDLNTDLKTQSNDSKHSSVKKTDSMADTKDNDPRTQNVKDQSTDKTTSDDSKASAADNTKAAVKKTDQDTQKTDASTKTDGTGKSDAAVSKDDSIDSQVLGQIDAMIDIVQKYIMDMLGISKDQLNQLMKDQGLTPVDLLQPENLQKLVLANSGQTDIMAALTDEKLADTMKQLIQKVEQIKTDAALPLTDEQIKDIVTKAEAKATDIAPVVTSQEASVVNAQQQQDKVSVNQTAKADVQQDKQDKQDTGSAKEVTVEVTKLTDAKENGTGTHADVGKDTNKDLKASDPFQAFVNNLVKSTQEIQLDSFGNTVQTTELKEIVNQIVDRIKIIVKPEQTSMELQLNPEELGKVNLTIQSKNGVMTAQFVVQNEMSKEAIESQMSTLKETLNQQGIKVDAIDVTVASYTFEQKGQADSQGQPENQKNQSGRKLSVEDAIQMTDADVPEEAGKADISGLTGSNIDYTA